MGLKTEYGKRDSGERAFRFALANIKPQDAVIVGIYPRFKDEIAENVGLVRRITSGAAADGSAPGPSTESRPPDIPPA